MENSNWTVAPRAVGGSQSAIPTARSPSSRSTPAALPFTISRSTMERNAPTSASGSFRERIAWCASRTAVVGSKERGRSAVTESGPVDNGYSAYASWRGRRNLVSRPGHRSGMSGRVATIDLLLRERHLLKHPFYLAWSRGELPIDTLRAYAGQYYHFESNFPRYVAAAYSQLRIPAERRVLLDNLVDEEGRDPTHPELWLDFAQGLGLSRRAARTARPTGPTRELLSTYERLTSAGPASALAALYSYESIFPEIAAEKSRGIRAMYGVRDPRAHEFFRVHTGADVDHSRAERRVLEAELGRSAPSRGVAMRAAKDAIGAWWSFLDGFPCA